MALCVKHYLPSFFWTFQHFVLCALLYGTSSASIIFFNHLLQSSSVRSTTTCGRFGAGESSSISSSASSLPRFVPRVSGVGLSVACKRAICSWYKVSLPFASAFQLWLTLNLMISRLAFLFLSLASLMKSSCSWDFVA